jgi:hypothetical protein
MFTDLAVYIIVSLLGVLAIGVFFLGYFGTVLSNNYVEFLDKTRRGLLKFSNRLWKLIRRIGNWWIKLEIRITSLYGYIFANNRNYNERVVY